MPTSEARIAANRANSLKSTGPRTSSGKEASRRNALKHGLTGAGVALPTEDQDAVAERIAAFHDDFRPETAAGQFLATRAAMLSVRMERCVTHESAAISERIRNAEVDFDEERLDEVARLYALLEDDPETACRKLRRMPEGVDRMIDAWTSLREDLTRVADPCWTVEHRRLADQLMGREPEGFGNSRVDALTRALRGDFTHVGDEAAGTDEPGRRRWAREALAHLIDDQVSGLIRQAATLDTDLIARSRAAAASRAIFDPSKAATLARQYEAAAERGFFRAIRDLEAVEAAAAEVAPAPAPAPIPTAPPGTMASFYRAEPPPEAAAPAPAPEASKSPFVPALAVDEVPASVGRAGGG